MRRAWVMAGAILASAVPALGVSVEEAAQHVGRPVTLEGFVEQVMCSPRACLLSFDSGWSGLVATIANADLPRFPDPKKTFERRRVTLRGVVENRAGRLRLEVTDPSRIAVTDAAGTRAGSQVLSAEESPREGGDEPAPQPRTRVEVSGGLGAGAGGSPLGDIVSDLQAEAAPSAPGESGASSVAVRGLRERVAVQSETIRSLEDELGRVRERIEELEARPAAGEQAPSSLEGVPELESWVVPARRGLSDPRPRTGWSTDRLVRELGPPLEVSEVSRDRAVWIYGDDRAVTVARGRVVSSSGF